MMDSEKYPLALPQGTVLAGQYIIERVLGQGGFGITYAATDHKTGERVAVKEFFPDSMATRSATTVLPFTGERGDSFSYGKDCFLQEAETLAQFIGNENIVRIHNYFEENGTAYFVMDYVEGTSFDQYIREHGGKVSFEEAERFLVPVMDALAAVHSKGIVHRDVTPDNIYITKDGVVKLLDFGAARYSLGDKSRSLDVVLKHGFAPKEQYTRRGRQGPYTDVYALGASFYYALTGKRPPDSVERMDEDDLVPPSVLGVKIGEAPEQAILQALSVQPADRFQTMTAFKNAMKESDIIEARTQAENAMGRTVAQTPGVTQQKFFTAPQPQAAPMQPQAAPVNSGMQPQAPQMNAAGTGMQQPAAGTAFGASQPVVHTGYGDQQLTGHTAAFIQERAQGTGNTQFGNAAPGGTQYGTPAAGNTQFGAGVPGSTSYGTQATGSGQSFAGSPVQNSRQFQVPPPLDNPQAVSPYPPQGGQVKKNNTGLIVGIVVAIVALLAVVGAGIFFFNRPSDDDDDISLASIDDEEPTKKPTPTLVPAVPADPTPAEVIIDPEPTAEPTPVPVRALETYPKLLGNYNNAQNGGYICCTDAGDAFFYVEMNENQLLYNDGSDEIIVHDNFCWGLTMVDKRLYFVSTDGCYSCKEDGSDKQRIDVLDDFEVDDLYISKDYYFVYTLNIDDDVSNRTSLLHVIGREDGVVRGIKIFGYQDGDDDYGSDQFTIAKDGYLYYLLRSKYGYTYDEDATYGLWRVPAGDVNADPENLMVGADSDVIYRQIVSEGNYVYVLFDTAKGSSGIVMFDIREDNYTDGHKFDGSWDVEKYYIQSINVSNQTVYAVVDVKVRSVKELWSIYADVGNDTWNGNTMLSMDQNASVWGLALDSTEDGQYALYMEYYEGCRMGYISITDGQDKGYIFDSTVR
ncbi:MAG: protein kinase [Lachnospiraceae bacterium]|nr:protein kinase [Lachnospiraceae bacterium]